MHIDFQYKNLVHCIKFSKKEQKKLINWFSNQNILIQIDIFEEQKNQFFKLKNKCKEVEVVPLAAFLLAIHYFNSLESEKNSKNKQNNLATSSKISRFAILKAKKERYKEKREKLLNLWSKVQELKAEGFSFRQISDYLRGHHRFEVSHTYIRNVWEELENGN
jgi:hypothetical protein